MPNTDLPRDFTSEMVREEGHNIFIGSFAALASYALFHVVTIFPLSWIAFQGSQTTAD